MPRVVNEEDYTIRRNQIIDSALKFVYSKGYGEMTIQDILDDLSISKGAFYHYFDSKAAVLEALIERLVSQVEPIIVPIVRDPELSALEKLHLYYDSAAQWKAGRKELLFEIIKIWYADENLMVRQKLTTKTLEWIAPMLTQIIQQGVQEHVFNTEYPDYVSGMNIHMIQGLSDGFVRLLLNRAIDPEAQQKALRLVAAYTDALTRVLGAQQGSIRLMDDATITEWFSFDQLAQVFSDEPTS